MSCVFGMLERCVEVDFLNLISYVMHNATVMGKKNFIITSSLLNILRLSAFALSGRKRACMRPTPRLTFSRVRQRTREGMATPCREKKERWGELRAHAQTHTHTQQLIRKRWQPATSKSETIHRCYRFLLFANLNQIPRLFAFSNPS